MPLLEINTVTFHSQMHFNEKSFFIFPFRDFGRFFILFFVACRKELDHPLVGSGPAGTLTERDSGSGLGAFQSAYEFTILGSPKSIPYAVNTIRDACGIILLPDAITWVPMTPQTSTASVFTSRGRTI